MAPRKSSDKQTKCLQPTKPLKASKAPASKNITKQPVKPVKNTIAPKNTKNVKRPRNGVFRGQSFAITGDFGTPYTHTNIERWIINNGGRVEQKVSSETTHLLCSSEDFRSKVDHVKDAWKLGKSHCKIMHIDYVLDILIEKKPRLVSEKENQLLKKLSQKRKAEKEEARKKNGGKGWVEGLKDLANPALYRLYYDSTFFEYKVDLIRSSVNANGKPLVEKYTIYLYQSKAQPHDYMSGARYKKGSFPPVLYRDKCFGKSFDDAFREFKAFFRSKSGIDWDQRFAGIKPGKGENAFTYVVPSGGKPVGELPVTWVEEGTEKEV